MDRRSFLKTAGAGAALSPLAAASCRREPPRWGPDAYVKPARSPVAVLRAERYDGPLEDLLFRGLELFPLDVRGRRVVLKPNLVEYDPGGVINTHPALVAAAIAAFRRLGAADVMVAEGPGHRRDNEYLLSASELLHALREQGARYVDLNTDAVRAVPLRTRFTGLGSLYLPETVLGADLLVSMPKLKTHHWAGVTLSLKNLFGIVPGAVYGWPKNLLHWAGIDGSILDINAALRVPRFNIVDGIIGMEGDGPIRGTPRHTGALVLGPDPVAVDATAARLMGLDPDRIGYLSDADAFLGNIAETAIDHAAEDPAPLRQDFHVLEPFEHLRAAARSSGS